MCGGGVIVAKGGGEKASRQMAPKGAVASSAGWRRRPVVLDGQVVAMVVAGGIRRPLVGRGVSMSKGAIRQRLFGRSMHWRVVTRRPGGTSGNVAARLR